MLAACPDSIFPSQWVDYNATYTAARAALIPWPWHVQYSTQDDHRPPSVNGQPNIISPCPSKSRKLAAFVIVNAVTLAATLILGRRTVVNRISCGMLGKPEGSPFWILSALAFIGLSIGANFINATIIRATPGFESTSMIGLVLLWCSRPRIAWLGTSLLGVEKDRGMYFGTAVSAILGEFVMQCLGVVYLGWTVNFGRQNGYYRFYYLGGLAAGGKQVYTMYCGAMMWIVTIPMGLLVMFSAIIAVFQLVKRLLRWLWTMPERRWQEGKFLSPFGKRVFCFLVNWTCFRCRPFL
jgi:hypothetical protein